MLGLCVMFLISFSSPPTCKKTSNQSEPEGRSQGSSLHGSFTSEDEEEEERQGCESWKLYFSLFQNCNTVICVCLCVCVYTTQLDVHRNMTLTPLSSPKPRPQYQPIHPGCRACRADCGHRRYPGCPGWMPGWAAEEERRHHVVTK